MCQAENPSNSGAFKARLKFVVSSFHCLRTSVYKDSRAINVALLLYTGLRLATDD